MATMLSARASHRSSASTLPATHQDSVTPERAAPDYLGCAILLLTIALVAAYATHVIVTDGFDCTLRMVSLFIDVLCLKLTTSVANAVLRCNSR